MTTIYYTLESFMDAIKKELMERLTDSIISSQRVVKANDIVLNGIVVRNNGSDIAPTLYVNDYHAQHMEGRTFDSIIDEIIDIANNADAKGVAEKAENVLDFDSIKDCLTIRLLSEDLNHEYLETHVHKPVGGGLVITVDITYENGYRVAVTNGMADSFDLDAMFDTAIANMMRMHPARLTSMEHAILGASSENALTNGANHMDGMSVLTGEDSNVFGASVLAYPMVIDRVLELYGMDVFVIPSSQHEVLIVPVQYRSLGPWPSRQGSCRTDQGCRLHTAILLWCGCL